MTPPAIDAMTTQMFYEFRPVEKPQRQLDPSIAISRTWEIEPIRSVAPSTITGTLRTPPYCVATIQVSARLPRTWPR